LATVLQTLLAPFDLALVLAEFLPALLANVLAALLLAGVLPGFLTTLLTRLLPAFLLARFLTRILAALLTPLLLTLLASLFPIALLGKRRGGRAGDERQSHGRGHKLPHLNSPSPSRAFPHFSPQGHFKQSGHEPTLNGADGVRVMQPTEVVDFWRNAGRQSWFKKDPAFDADCGRFRDWHFAAAGRELDDWIAVAEGALGLLLLLDQFPRNLFRGTAHAFATDGLARMFARRAVGEGHDLATEPLLRPFFYLPFEHSEDPADQTFGVGLCERLERDTGDTDTLKWARIHRDIIARFGRFPHRNAVLGRETTALEQAFLDDGGFAG
jgi:uncharacterized protein (DUF924 family)